MLFIFLHPDCTVGFGVSPNHALRLVGCTTGRELHPALKISYLNSGEVYHACLKIARLYKKSGRNRDKTGTEDSVFFG